MHVVVKLPYAPCEWTMEPSMISQSISLRARAMRYGTCIGVSVSAFHVGSWYAHVSTSGVKTDSGKTRPHTYIGQSGWKTHGGPSQAASCAATTMCWRAARPSSPACSAALVLGGQPTSLLGARALAGEVTHALHLLSSAHAVSCTRISVFVSVHALVLMSNLDPKPI